MAADRDRHSHPGRPPVREWVGGRFPFPGYVLEEGPYRPDVFVWLDVADDQVLGATVVDPREPEPTFADSLRDALRRPLAGPPRLPLRIRVADETLAAEARAALGGAPGVPVVVAPTPELEAVRAAMTTDFARPGSRDRTWLDGDRLPAAAVADLFAAAELLWAAAPWRLLSDDQVIRLDVPALGIDGACISVIGELGQTHGFLVFPSRDGYEAFLAAADPGSVREGDPIDLGTSILSLTFERGADLPAAMRREIARHGWGVAAPEAHPLLLARDRDGLDRPLAERELRLAAAVASGLAAFVDHHATELRRRDCPPISGSCTVGDGLAVRLTLPYEAFGIFDVDQEPAAPPASKLGRNDPCHCGSGRKYKRCHLADDRRREAAAPASGAHATPAAAPVPPAGRDPLHDLDTRLVHDLLRWADRRFPGWLAGVMRHLDYVEPSPGIAVPWALFHAPVHDKPVADWFLAERGRTLSAHERGWLEAQRRAWISVWEVTAVEPGVGLTLADQLSGEVRTVRERAASTTARLRDAILARIVDHGGRSLLLGVHEQPLPPRDAAEVVRRARGRLRRKTAVPPERLRDADFLRYLITAWEEEVPVLAGRAGTLPDLHNTDGDPFLLTEDRFAVAPGARAALARVMAGLPGVLPPEDDDPEPSFAFTRPGNAMHRGWENTTIGMARFDGDVLVASTNSTRRADDLRARLESAGGTNLHHLGRTQTSPRDLAAKAAAAPPRPEPTSPELQAIARDMKARHYAGWVDEPLPALRGRTPREAARTADGRREVDLLLKEIESLEWRLPEAERFDVRPLREALGIAG